METRHEDYFDLATLTANEFDVPATLVPERETELHNLLQFVRERLELAGLRDVSSRIQAGRRRASPTCSPSSGRTCTTSCAST